ncbi:methyltransferase corrinoid activation protein [Lachnospiraceae bacterium KM106-2]|nr:methyltransferase corrinoid activation protein [Lachnospiraceae bacterium KM106-2]
MKITFMPMNQTIRIENFQTILNAAREAGIYIESSCGLNGSCGKCKVYIMKGRMTSLTAEEEKHLTKEEIKRGIRLACQVRASEDAVVMVKQTKERKVRNVVRQTEKVESIGIGIDIGTTTIQIRLIDLISKGKLMEQIIYNPQRMFGADVISRITYCYGNKERLVQLQRCLIDSCNEEIHSMLSALGQTSDCIKQYVVAGNTTMGHLFLGCCIDSLGRSPIAPVYKDYPVQAAEQIGLIGNQDTKCYLLPNIGGHVGGDLLACLMTAKLDQKKGNYLLIDVGTNGEIAVSKQGKIMACSTAAGPAFEGASLQYGMCAKAGAITHVAYYQKKPVIEVLGNVKPIGISGSGIIDGIAEFLRNDIIDRTGLLKEEYQSSGVALYEGTTKEERISISQEDIRQIQLAKGAIAAGMALILEKAELNVEEIDEFYLAGTFGSHLNVRNAMAIGLLPKMAFNKVKLIGNASCEGTNLVLNGKWNYDEIKEFAKQISHIDLAKDARFEEVFLEKMNF